MIKKKFENISITQMIIELKKYKICFEKITEVSEYAAAKNVYTCYIENINRELVQLNEKPSSHQLYYIRCNLSVYDNAFKFALRGAYQ